MEPVLEWTVVSADACMTRPELRRDRVVHIDFESLSDADRRTWGALLEFAGSSLGLSIEARQYSGVPSLDAGEFAFIADSGALTRKLLLNVARVFVLSGTAPRRIDPMFYLMADAGSHLSVCTPVEPTTTLISSVFKGDEYLNGFLSNMGELQGYAECEHLLIRPGSPGNEHEALLAHVRDHPSATYINLSQDPGLYAVWNFGVRLATARYVSNANIDDRRAPEQLIALQAALVAHPEVSVVSTTLRVTAQKNMPWVESEGCRLMFSDTPEQVYHGAGLFKRAGNRLASRNLPHCMPLWRRSLHVFVGHFNENRYGPSADWAFWLNAAELGASLYFKSVPLGLYLRDEGSYWRRNIETERFDARIAEEFSALADAAPGETGGSRQELASLAFGSAVESLRQGAVLEGLGRLLHVAASGDVLCEDTATLFDKACRFFLGCSEPEKWLERYSAGKGLEALPETALFNAIVDLVHEFNPVVYGLRAKKVARNLALACVDWMTSFDEIQGLLLLALLSRQKGDLEQELQLLKRCHAGDAKKFWCKLQTVYRFKRPLADVCKAVGEPNVWTPEHPVGNYRIVFYPEYTNAYQSLLYEPLIAAGGYAEGCKNLEAFFGAVFVHGADNILHVHWLNQIFGKTNITDKALKQLASSFLSWIDKKKSEGFRIWWTIHNYVSHESVDLDAEIVFQKKLYKKVDRVFIHHPLAIFLLDWLPDHEKLFLCEHGSYDTQCPQKISRTQARHALGFSEADWVVAHVGRVRGYKGLDMALPALYSQLDNLPCMRLLIAGKIDSAETKAWLALHPHPRVTVLDQYLNEETLLYAMRAANLGFLSYNTVLTSGSLVHWFSCGRPVLAPAAGTIPAYLINGWNGFDYNDDLSLAGCLKRISQMHSEDMDRLECNALSVAQRLGWIMWG